MSAGRGRSAYPAPLIQTQDETQVLAEATAVLSDSLQKVIGDADYLLGEMSEGNFAIATNSQENASDSKAKPFYKNSIFYIMGFLLFLYLGLENCVNGWFVTYFKSMDIMLQL